MCLFYQNLISASNNFPQLRISQNQYSQKRIIEAECVLNFLDAMKSKAVPGMIEALKEGRDRGGFPDWMLEYGKNLLRSCDSNSILFTGSHADTNAAWYIQYIEDFRKDITVIPIGLLNQSWFLKILREKSRINQNNIPVSEAILNGLYAIENSGPIIFPLSRRLRKKFGLSREQEKLEWINRKKLFNQKGSYCNENISVLIDILQKNNWQRKTYFTLDCNQKWMRGLEDYLQMSGVVFQLIPVRGSDSIPITDQKKTAAILFSDDNFRNIERIRDAKNVELDSVRLNYLSLFFHAARFYDKMNMKQEACTAVAKMKSICSDSSLFRPDIVDWMEETINREQ